MDPKIIPVLVEFMQRVQLTSREIPAWNACMAELQRLAQEKTDKPA